MAEQQLARRFRRWYSFEIDVDEKVWESFDSVPPEQRTGELYQSALDLFAHMLAARQMWLHRIGALAQPPEKVSPRGSTRRGLIPVTEATQRAWLDYLERLDDAELERAVRYGTAERGRYESTVEEILTQLHGHGCQHRGQIASLLRRCGGTPAMTDYIAWSRRRVDAS